MDGINDLAQNSSAGKKDANLKTIIAEDSPTHLSISTIETVKKYNMTNS